MKRFLLASAALVALTGVAYSQEAPYLSGNYSASVTRNHSAASNRGHGAYNPGPRVYYRDAYRPRYYAPDYYMGYDEPYYPRHRHHHRHAFGPRTGFSIGIGGHGFGFGFSDYDNGWR